MRPRAGAFPAKSVHPPWLFCFSMISTAKRTMDNCEPLPLSPANNSCLVKVKESTPLFQMIKASNVLRIIQVVQRVAQKSCRRACQLFCCPIDSLLCEKAASCPDEDHQSAEAKTAQVALQSPPSTILILNISNSTLVDCIIGNDSYHSAVAESHPFIQESSRHMHNQMRCRCSHGQGEAQTSPPPHAYSSIPSQEPPRINIHSSHLSCVIIGDNNYMNAEHVELSETAAEEPQM